jgi:hypothetical protein
MEVFIGMKMGCFLWFFGQKNTPNTLGAGGI